MEHGEKHITVVDEEGNEQLCEILLTFESKDYGKSYVLYYPVGTESDEIFASSFTPSEGEEEGDLQPIETEEEWDMVEEMLNTFLGEEEEEE